MRLAERLASLGLYRPQSGGIVAGELAAYQAGFALLEQQLERLERLTCPSRMESAQLIQYCRLLGYEPPAQLTHAELRQAFDLLLTSYKGWSLAELEQRLRALGAQVIVQEAGNTVVLYYDTLQGIVASSEQLQDLALAFLPAGVPVRLETGGPDWSQLDAAGYTASELEAKAFTWTQFDTNGYTFLEG